MTKFDKRLIVAAGLSVAATILIPTLFYIHYTPSTIPNPPSPPAPIIIKEHQSTTFEATGYAIGSPYSTITKLGQPVINRSFMQIGGVDIFTIAVDPTIIPLGSLVYIDSLGLALASDTGGKIKGMLIDICFTTMDEAMRWGRRNVEICILRRGL